MFKFGNVEIGGADPVVIAEAGVNHLRDKKLAIEIIMAAKRAGAGIVKFQTYTAEKLTTANAPRFWQWSGEHVEDGSQRDSYKKLETADLAFTKFLLQTCEEIGVEFMSTPFDLEAASMLDEIGSKGFKIASGDLLNVPLLEKVASFKKPVFLSTGAANLEEIQFSINTLERNGASDICIMQCTLCYPTRIEDANLSALLDIRAHFPGYVLGLSDHTIGTLVPALSTMYGSMVIEKHFTVDKSLPDSADHWLSVDEVELSQLVDYLKAAKRSVGSNKKRMLECEIPTRLNARRSLVVVGEIRKGEKFTEKNLTTKRPGTGIAARFFHDVCGLTASRDLRDDHMLGHDDILEDAFFMSISEKKLKSANGII